MVAGHLALVAAEQARAAVAPDGLAVASSQALQTGPLIDHSQGDSRDAFVFQRQGANGPGGANLPAVVAGRLTAGPVGDDGRRPEVVQAAGEAHRLKNVVGADAEALATANAQAEEVLLGNAARRANERLGLRGAEPANTRRPGDPDHAAGRHPAEKAATRDLARRRARSCDESAGISLGATARAAVGERSARCSLCRRSGWPRPGRPRRTSGRTYTLPREW